MTNRKRANPLQVFLYRGGWCWTCWHGSNHQAIPHKASHGFLSCGDAADAARQHFRAAHGLLSCGDAADAARQHFRAAHPAELIVMYAIRGAAR